MSDDKVKFILNLFEAKVVRFGSFTLKGGHVSPVYFDLRLLISHPKILKAAAHLIADKVKEKSLVFDHVCGVPLAALPLATSYAIPRDLPMIMPRKEIKGHGTNSLVEGVFERGDTSLVIEDTAVSGRSVAEVAESLDQRCGINVTDAIVVLDRLQGGASNLQGRGITLHACTDVFEVMDVLHAEGKVDEETVTVVKSYVNDNQFQF